MNKTIMVAGMMMVAKTAFAGSMVTIQTPSVTPDVNGYVNCVVTAKSVAPIGIVAIVVDEKGMNVTDFGSGFRVSPAASGDGYYHAEETAGSLNDAARSCKATVSGALRKNVNVVLSVYDAAGNVVASVVGK